MPRRAYLVLPSPHLLLLNQTSFGIAALLSPFKRNSLYFKDAHINLLMFSYCLQVSFSHSIISYCRRSEHPTVDAICSRSAMRVRRALARQMRTSLTHNCGIAQTSHASIIYPHFSTHTYTHRIYTHKDTHIDGLTAT
jgi:hypothetical protein